MQIEYNIDRCATDLAEKDCIDSRQISLSLPTGGDVIYGVAHQHTGGIGSTLYGEVLQFLVFFFTTSLHSLKLIY